MTGKPAARLGDTVQHPMPPVLTRGPGSQNVYIGGKPAWRGLPAMQAQIIKDAKQAGDKVVKAAEKATDKATPPPVKVIAYAAEQGEKGGIESSIGGLITSTAASAAPPAIVDIHACVTPSRVVPHGPGVVIDGSNTVLINGLPACFVGNTILEPLGEPNKITGGCQTVLIGTGPAVAVSVDTSKLTDSIQKEAEQAGKKAEAEAKLKQQQENAPKGPF
ncbi:PAAR domain-containing protein [Nostoc sp.]|uniref:PAAR domain-containing protein n=1 Tax=Nostoc sp. TaxID=1180 RepID=UPI002FF89C1B